MSGGGYKVETAELDTHSKQVSGIADELAQARSAGQSATPLGSDAFGIIGQAFATTAQGAVSAATRNLEAASATARQLSAGVGRSGKAYRQAEDGTRRQIKRIHQEL